MPVAVFDDGKWHRAEILCICGPDAFLHFVDFGCRKYVKVDNLRYLEKTFATPSRKACRGSMIGVKPKNYDSLWSPTAIMKFMSKTKGVKMYAIVKGQDDGFFQLQLVDDVINRTKVSDYLIAEGVADEDTGIDMSMNAILVS